MRKFCGHELPRRSDGKNPPSLPDRNVEGRMRFTRGRSACIVARCGRDPFRGSDAPLQTAGIAMSRTAVAGNSSPGGLVLRTLAALERHPWRTLGVYALLLAVQISPWWYASKDDCLYISVARSMVRGESTHCLGNERIFVGPGFPAILSPAFLVGERPFLALSVIQWVISLALIAGVYRWCRRHDAEHAALLTGFCILNITIWYYFRRPLKEIAFLTTLVWSINLLHPLFEWQPLRRTALLCAGGSALLAFALFIRLTGVVLVPAFVAAVAWQAWRKNIEWKRAAVLAAVVGVAGGGSVLGQVVYDRQQEAKNNWRPSYATTFSRRVADSNGLKLLTGVRDRVGEVGRIVLPGTFKLYAETDGPFKFIEVPFLLATAVLITGWIVLVRRRIELLALMLPMYAGIYALNAVNQGARLAVPMAPVLMLCFWLGLKQISKCDVRVLGGLTAAHLAVAIAYWVGIDMPRAIAADRNWAAVDKVVATVGDDPVAFADELKTTRSMLLITFDRVVPDYDPDVDLSSAVPQSAAKDSATHPKWVVSKASAEIEGYDLHSEEGGMKLWKSRNRLSTQVAAPIETRAKH